VTVYTSLTKAEDDDTILYPPSCASLPCTSFSNVLSPTGGIRNQGKWKYELLASKSIHTSTTKRDCQEMVSLGTGILGVYNKSTRNKTVSTVRQGPMRLSNLTATRADGRFLGNRFPPAAVQRYTRGFSLASLRTRIVPPQRFHTASAPPMQRRC
jgi:hypothetical protein